MSRPASEKSALMRVRTSTTEVRGLTEPGLGVGDGLGLGVVVLAVVVVVLVVVGDGLGVGLGLGVVVGRGVGAGQVSRPQTSVSTKGWHSPPRLLVRMAPPHDTGHGPQACQVPHCTDDTELGQASVPQASDSSVEVHPAPERVLERSPPPQVTLQPDHWPQAPQLGAAVGQAVWLQAPDSVKD